MIWPILYGPYIIWGRGVNPVNHKVRGSFGINAKFKIILERKCLKVLNRKCITREWAFRKLKIFRFMNKFMVFGSLPQLNYIGEIVFLNGE